MVLRACCYALLMLSTLSSAVAASGAALEDFFGVYVGRAQVRDGDGTLLGERDLDITIEAGRMGGFKVSWISVELVDGRRDVLGVERHILESAFQAPKDGTYAEDTRRTLFATRGHSDLLKGDTLRWARIEGEVLSVFSLAVLPEGGYEVQAYERRLTEAGLDISFRRIVDDQVVLTVEGKAVRVPGEGAGTE